MSTPTIDPRDAVQIAIDEKRREIAQLETEVEALKLLKESPAAIKTLVKAFQGAIGGLSQNIGPKMLKRLIQQVFEESNVAWRVAGLVEHLVKTRHAPVSENEVHRLLVSDPDFETPGRGWWQISRSVRIRRILRGQQGGVVSA